MFPFLLSLTAAFTHHHIDNQHQRHVSLENAVLWDKELGDISVLCGKESGKKYRLKKSISGNITLKKTKGVLHCKW